MRPLLKVLKNSFKKYKYNPQSTIKRQIETYEKNDINFEDENSIISYLDNKKLDNIEGIWNYEGKGRVPTNYKFLIIKEGFKYKCYVIEGQLFWQPSDLKAEFETAATDKIVSISWKKENLEIEKSIGKVTSNALIEFKLRERKDKSDAMMYKVYPKINNISSENVSEILGVPISKALYENNDVVGVTTGLAWTQYGGEILFIESILSPGKGLLSITGNLGKVMKESATIALEFIKSNSSEFGIDSEIFKKYNFHLHVPEGATPKDGPSAGITMLTSLVSLLTQRKVKDKFAMTGEITLRGKVLPVGGIKEKILAEKRANIKQIVLSTDNKKNVDEIDSKYLKGLKFHYVNTMKEVIEISLHRNKVSNHKKLI